MTAGASVAAGRALVLAIPLAGPISAGPSAPVLASAGDGEPGAPLARRKCSPLAPFPIRGALRHAALPAAAAAILALAGCGRAEQPVQAAPGAMEKLAEQEDARKAADKTRRSSEANLRSAARVKADMERFERSEREAGR